MIEPPTRLRRTTPIGRTAPAAIGPLAVAVALAACGGGGPAGAAVVVDTVAGVERLSYAAEPAGELGWTIADTVAVIGEAMGPEEYHFGAPGPDDLAGDDEGGVLVVDRDGSRVLRYGPDGAHRATYGREGAGPGELRFPAGVTVGPGDTLWVNDLGNRRLTGYPREGGEPRTVPYARSDIFPRSRIAVLDDGLVQVVGALRGSPGEPVPEPLLRLDRDLQPLDTLWLPAPDQIDMVELDFEGRTIIIGVPQTFHPEFHWRHLSDGRVVVADSADYVFRIIDHDGAVRRVVRREPPARATTDADRQAARDAILGELGFAVSIDGSGPGEDSRRRMAEARAEAMTFNDRIPRILELVVDRQDRIWVGVSEDSADAVQRIDIYRPDGTLLGELRDFPMPETFTGTDRFLTTRRDELDVPQIVVQRLETRPSTSTPVRKVAARRPAS